MLFKIIDYGVMIVSLFCSHHVYVICKSSVCVYGCAPMHVHAEDGGGPVSGVLSHSLSFFFFIPLRQDILLNLRFATSLRLAGQLVNSGIHSSLPPQLYGLVIYRHAWFLHWWCKFHPSLLSGTPSSLNYSAIFPAHTHYFKTSSIEVLKPQHKYKDHRHIIVCVLKK